MGSETAQSLEAGSNKLAAGVEQVGNTLETIQTEHQTAQVMPQLALDQQQRMQDLKTLTDNISPNNLPTALQQYTTDTLGPAKEQFLQQFTTPKAKAYAEAKWGDHVAELYAHAGAFSQMAAGDAAHNALIGGTNILIANVSKNPTLLDANLQAADAAINDMANRSTMSPEAKHMLVTTASPAIKADMVSAAVKTLAEDSPDAARQLLSSGKYDAIIGPHIGTLNTYINVQEKQLQARQKADEVQTRQVETDTAKEAMTNAVAGTITPQGIRVTPDYFKSVQDVIAMPGAQKNPELVKAFVDYGQAALDRQAKGIKATTDPTTFSDFQNRLFKDPGDPTALTYKDLYTAAAAGKLSDHDVSFFNQAIGHADKPENADANRIRAEGISALKTIVNPKDQFGTPMIGTPGAAAYAESRALSWFNRTAQAGMQTGKYKTMQDAVDDLVTPEKLKQFAPTTAPPTIPPAAGGTKPSLDSIFGGFFGSKK